MIVEMSHPIAVARAFSPGSVTGFYSEFRNSSHLHSGSYGAGFCIDKGVETEVRIYDYGTYGFEILINGNITSEAKVSEYVIQTYLRMSSKPLFVKVTHNPEIPIGYGLGSSGAGALSLSYALNKALGTGLTDIQASQVAHCAEIYCRTGLGTVLSEFSGGFNLRVIPGAPGIGAVEKINFDGQKIVIICLSPIYTHNLQNIKRMTNRKCMENIQRILTTADLEIFFRISYLAGLLNINKVSKRSRHILQTLNKYNIPCSLALFGETIFTLGSKSEIDDIVSPYDNLGILMDCEIENKGVRLL
jgi:pantoate kinase